MSTINIVEKTILVTSGSKIFTISTEDGSSKTFDVTSVASSTPTVKKPRADEENDEKENLNAGKEAHSILCSVLSNNKSLYIVGLSSKIVLIFNVDNLSLKRKFRIPKAPTSLVFDKDDEFVLVGDRAGHVCRYNVEEPINVSHKDITGEMCGHEGEPLTGVISMVLDVKVSPDGRFLMFADRDEKVRVSRYPNAFVTQSYCLGHSEYIRSISLIDGTLFSSGGDSTIIRWNYEEGTLIRNSSRVSEQNAVRKIVGIKKEKSIFIYAIAENESNLYILEDNGSEIVARGSIKADDTLIDIAISGNVICGVTKSSVVNFDLSNNTCGNIEVSEEMKAELGNTKDPIGSYYKNVTHKNLEEYQKRKAQRMESEREKKRRKKEKNRKSNGTEAADS